MKIVKALFYILIFVLIFNFKSNAQNNVFIEVKIGNEIVTNLDIIMEEKYLIALNNNLSQLSKNDIKNLAKKSVVNEKIKKQELLKYFDFQKAESFMEKIIEDLYIRLNLKNKKDLEKYLSNFDLKIEDVSEKIKIETLWNQFIFDKFSNQVLVDKDKLRNNLKNKLLEEKYKNEEYLLYEILFKMNSNESLEKKYKIIVESIDRTGFENTSNLYSISNNAKFGGKIGWINKTQLSKKIINEIKKIKVGNITRPIQANNGFLILKLANKRKIETKINFEKELKKVIIYEKNKQLNQLSLIYFNKIKQNILISES